MWEELLKPGATGAPLIIEWIAAGIGLAGSVFYGRMQIRKGKAEGSAGGQKTVELAGAVIDAKKADELVAALRKNSAALDRNSEQARELHAALTANTTAAISTGGEVVEARAHIRELTNELIRNTAGGR
jgi:hypothetical protein